MKSKTFKIGFAIILFFTLISLIINVFFYKNYTTKVNESVINIISAVKEQYPDVADEELIRVLNNQNEHSYNLEKYGISSDDIYMLENTRTIYNISIASNVTITALLGVTLGAMLMTYIKNRKNKVNEINSYIKEINKRNYALKLEENDEDELSMLQNELYKITVLLKEQSENAMVDKKNVKDSMSDISHQLKTPLTSIMIALDNIIDNKTMSDETREEFLLDMKKQVENINFLISSILKLSRFDANVIKFVKQDINVKALLTEILKNLDNISSSKNVKIEINGEDDIVFVGDYKWELEALTNIIKNGIEHLDDGGIIKISYRKLSIYTEIIIEDNGKGIEPKDLKHIFERFYKGKNSAIDSIGIGLSLSKKIIENDNGYIAVTSELNKGTKFVIKYMKK